MDLFIFRVKIIDDDIDLSHLGNVNDEESDLFATGEDAPQIVGVIDDRPPELQALDYKNSNKWRVVSSNNEITSNKTLQHASRLSKNEDEVSSPKRQKQSSKHSKTYSDLSPIRRKVRDDISPDSSSRDHHKRKKYKDSPDLSPKRKFKNNSSPDLSPKRKFTNNSSPDLSPKRIHKRYSNESSPDQSPRRRHSTSRKKLKHKSKESSSDLSPVRKKSPDLSPIRKYNSNRSSSSDLSPKRKYKSSNSSKRYKSPSMDLSSRHKSNSSNTKHSKKSRWNDSPETSSNPSKSSKTLEGKKAGLQKASDLKIEIEELRKKSLYETLPDELSGKDAEVVFRDRKTGKLRDLEKESEEFRKKDEKNKAKKAIYDQWGAGLKQIENHKSRLDELAHEMNKPLARYANDGDLDEFLKNQERDGDPMLEYLRQKEKEKRKANNEPELPKYEGLYPENRFGIRPGYRWDGVDRSNGFEKKWFDVISKRKASEEEAYRYSTEDM